VSGKVIVAVLLAASSASAATVGVVYSRFIAPHHERAAVMGGVGPAQRAAPVRTAVVLNASESLFEHDSDGSPDGAAPVCPTAADSHGCIMVMRPSDVRLKILGYTLTIPPLWLGGDSEDRYAATDYRNPWLGADSPDLEVFVHPAHRYARAANSDATSDGVNGVQDSPQGGSENGSDNASATGDPGPASSAEDAASLAPIVELIAPPTGVRSVTPFADYDHLIKEHLLDQLSSPAPTLDTPVADPSQTLANPPEFLASPTATFNIVQLQNSPAVPEPSTWLMMTTGLAAVGFLKRRRIWAALTSTLRRSDSLSDRQGTT
jgi:PEP-CTERM motif